VRRALALTLWLIGCGSDGAPPAPAVDAVAWPEADPLFRQDPHWVGADGAYSVALGDGRVVWLFGDTFVATDGSGQRAGSTMVHNTLAIQHGVDPSSAVFEPHWSPADGAPPASFFADASADEWFWPGQAALVGDRLLVFLVDVRRSSGGLGFENHGWDARLIDPSQPIDSWAAAPSLAPPQNDWSIVVGTGGAQVDGDQLVTYGTQEPTHDLFLVRWPVESVLRGDLSEPSWWDGAQWTPQAQLSSPARVIASSATELSVSRVGARLVEVETQGFGSAVLVVRGAADFVGPWSAAATVFRPPESDRPNVLVYAGKAHPELAGADLVATYASNSTDFSTLVADTTLYFPRFVRLTIR
jgi:hypothetical protein